MLQKTRGIVFHVIDYSDTSVVAKVYTEAFGLQSYLIHGIRGKKSKIKSGLLQPLSLLEMVVYHKEKNNLQKLKEIRLHTPYSSIPFDIVKTAIVIFLNEILYKSVKEEEKNPNLFEFIFNSLLILDLKNEHVANFHLIFLLKFTQYLGFFPHGNYNDANPYFDLKEGIFTNKNSNHPYMISGEICNSFHHLLQLSFDEMELIKISSNTRKSILESILLYLELHLSWKNNIKSHLVLETVMN